MDPQTPERPRLKAHLAVQCVGPDKVFLIAEDGHYLVRGEAAVAIAPYLDGRHTMADIVDAVSSRISFADCVVALSKFRRFGHIAECRDIGLSRPVSAAWDSRQVDPATASDRLTRATITLTSVGGGAMETKTTAAALAASGLRIRRVPWERIAEVDATFAVVLTDEYLDPRLAGVDAALRAANRPWLLSKPVGTEIWLGPYFRPGHTGCWRCLFERLDGNRAVGQYVRHVTGYDTPIRASIAALPSSVGLASHLIASAAVTAVVAGELPALDGVLMSLHSVSLQTERHELIRQPQCPACGDVTLVHRGPELRLESSRVVYSDDGGYRVLPPEATYGRLEKHISRLLGAVTSVRSLSSADDTMSHTYTSGHNFAVQPNIDGLRRTLRGQSGGKGRTDMQARASAVCEAIERYCGVWRDIYPTTRARYADLGPARAVPIDALLLFSKTQYAERTHWNRNGAGRLHHVPVQLDPACEISWTAGWSLTEERTRLLPSAYTWFGHPDLYRQAYCFPDANGNAAGNTMEEAILQGFCELVERDSVALWWYNRAPRPAVDLDSVDDPYVGRLQEFYAAQGREIWVLDATADLGIPTFVAASRRTDHVVEDVLLGFGAHLDPRLALIRALTELNQFLPAVRGRNPDGSTDYWEDDPATLAWWRETLVADEPWLLPDPLATPSRIDAHPSREPGDLADDVRLCVESARAAGLEVIVCDQSRPDIELNVVKVVVPGLRHFWRRLGEGRLYDVPVSLGWVDEPASEDSCNPISVFF